MKRRISIIICSIFFLSFFNVNIASSKEISTISSCIIKDRYDTNIKIVINSKNKKKIPSNFRKTNDKVILEYNENVNLKGLSTLNASGSAQFSENGLDFIKSSIGDNYNIFDVDLREESHGFINGTAISWEGDGNKLNKGLQKQQIIAIEKSQLKGISLGEKIVIKDKVIIPTKVENEEELVKSKGISYVRIPVTDGEIPRDVMVDYFIQFVRHLPKNSWLHFHCKIGKGRTTTFMAMYDILRNGKNVSLDDIMRRQYLIGGEEIFNNKSTIIGKESSKVKFLRNFYKYVNENNDDFKTTWTEWKKNNNIF